MPRVSRKLVPQPMAMSPTDGRSASLSRRTARTHTARKITCTSARQAYSTIRGPDIAPPHRRARAPVSRRDDRPALGGGGGPGGAHRAAARGARYSQRARIASRAVPGAGPRARTAPERKRAMPRGIALRPLEWTRRAYLGADSSFFASDFLLCLCDFECFLAGLASEDAAGGEAAGAVVVPCANAGTVRVRAAASRASFLNMNRDLQSSTLGNCARAGVAHLCCGSVARPQRV